MKSVHKALTVQFSEDCGIPPGDPDSHQWSEDSCPAPEPATMTTSEHEHTRDTHHQYQIGHMIWR